MRKYAAFYNGRKTRNLYHDYDGTWMIIFQDEGEEEWYIEVPDAGDKESAIRLVDALNLQARSYAGG